MNGKANERKIERKEEGGIKLKKMEERKEGDE